MSVVTKEMLDAAVVFGRNQERERIIKLLETKVLKNVLPDIHSLELLHNQLVNSLIVLIKGEQK